MCRDLRVQILIFMAVTVFANALQVQHEEFVPCLNFFWESSPVIIYNNAFEMSRNNMLQDWVFALEKESLTYSCVNASYYSAFDDPQLFFRIDLGRVAVRKSTCFNRGVLVENVSITQVPYFDKASLELYAMRDSSRPSHIHISASFKSNTPWILKIYEELLQKHVTSYLVRYFTLLVKTICI